MKATVLGLKTTNFEPKDKPGTRVVGVTAYIGYKDPDVTGQKVENVFLSDTKMDNLGICIPENGFKALIGREIEVEYNRYGKLANLLIGPPSDK